MDFPYKNFTSDIALIGEGRIFIDSGSARLVSFVIKLISKEISRA